MNLKSELDEVLARVFYLTEVLKKLTPLHDYTKNVRTNLVIQETCREYQTVSEHACQLLEKFIQQERTRGVTPLPYVRVYRDLRKKHED